MITSRSNEKIKFIRALKEKKFREESNLFIVEGLKSVKEAKERKQDIPFVVVTEKGSKLLDEDLYGFKEIVEVSEDVFKSLSDEVTPQGVLCVCQKPNNGLRSPKGNCLLLDGVSDSSNIGAIIRTAASCNYLDVYIANGADAYSPKAIRASMGGIFRVNVFSGERDELLKVIDVPLVVADMKGKDIYSVKVESKHCLVIGNEAHGVSDVVKKTANYTVSIPMQNGMESLNAAVSAGILMYFLSK